MRGWLVRLALCALLSAEFLSPAMAVQPLVAPDAPVPGAITERIELFFRDLAAERAREGFQRLLEGSPLAKQTAAIDSLVAKTPELPRLYGPPRGFEQVDARRIGNDVLVLRYLEKYETFPVVWHFTVYRAVDRAAPSSDPGRWLVVAVRYDTDIERLADERRSN